MGAAELGDDRRDAEEEAAQAGKDGNPNVDGDGDTGQIDGTGAAAENRAEDRRADLGHLGQEQGKKQGQKMTPLAAVGEHRNLLMH